jgi:maleate isomerase
MRDYCGWRARIGLVYMASSIVMEPECYAMAPEGVSIHTSRLHLPAVTASGLTEMMSEGPLEETTGLLARAPLDSAVFGGTSASFLGGRGYDDAVAQRMRAKLGGVPVTTTSTAALQAFAMMGVRRITFTGPYVPEVTDRGRRFFAENGLEVLGAHGMGIDGDHAIGDVPLEAVYRFVKSHVEPGSDAVFISCTNLRTVGAIAALEKDLGLPVVSAIQVSFWGALRAAGVEEKVEGFGSLFDLGRPDDVESDESSHRTAV